MKEHSFNDFVAWPWDESRRITEGNNERLKANSYAKHSQEQHHSKPLLKKHDYYHYYYAYLIDYTILI